MSTMHLHGIDHTVALTHEWVRQLSDLLDWYDDQRAYRLLRVTLQAVRDWLDVNEAAQLGAQLPILIRGLYYEGWRPARTPVDDRSRAAFVARIEEAMRPDHLPDVERAIIAVFRLHL
jgi:uncharacterized protein (DUF2267 family)